jgi:hypothetical protein
MRCSAPEAVELGDDELIEFGAPGELARGPGLL